MYLKVLHDLMWIKWWSYTIFHKHLHKFCQLLLQICFLKSFPTSYDCLASHNWLLNFPSPPSPQCVAHITLAMSLHATGLKQIKWKRFKLKAHLKQMLSGSQIPCLLFGRSLVASLQAISSVIQFFSLKRKKSFYKCLYLKKKKRNKWSLFTTLPKFRVFVWKLLLLTLQHNKKCHNS